MKIKMNVSRTTEEVFETYLIHCEAKGLSAKTIKSYRQQFYSLRKYLNITLPIEQLSKHDLETMVSSLRQKGYASQTIASYVRAIKCFLSWCNQENITALNIPLYKTEETIKETYTDEELFILLQKPNLRKCRFSEYRTWVIINFFLNSGCRASTLRNH